MIADTNIAVLPKTTRISFLQTHVTAQQTIVSSFTPLSGPYNDAVLELNRLNYLLTYAKTAKV